MKKLLTLAALVLSTSAVANTPEQIKFCTSISSVSTMIMTARQEGVPLMDSLKLASKPEFEDIKEILTGIIKLAYSNHKFSTDKVKKNTITEFANKITLQCLVDMKGKK